MCGNGYHYPKCINELPQNVPSEFYYCKSCMKKIDNKEVKNLILNFNVLNYVKDKKLSSELDFNER